jgi:hypothetical protein
LDKEGQAALQEAAEEEAAIVVQAYKEQSQAQLEYVPQERIERKISLHDLPDTVEEEKFTSPSLES